ncbi:hypothetical protein Holit_00886 [Hollandina sp. SP2]
MDVAAGHFCLFPILSNNYYRYFFQAVLFYCYIYIVSPNNLHIEFFYILYLNIYRIENIYVYFFFLYFYPASFYLSFQSFLCYNSKNIFYNLHNRLF